MTPSELSSIPGSASHTYPSSIRSGRSVPTIGKFNHTATSGTTGTGSSTTETTGAAGTGGAGNGTTITGNTIFVFFIDGNQYNTVTGGASGTTDAASTGGTATGGAS